MKTLKLWIPGTPRPKQSARFRIGNFRDKNIIMSYQTKEIKDEERSIKAIITEQLPNDFRIHLGPISVVSLIFLFPPLKSHSKKDIAKMENGFMVPKFTKPDLTDNLAKGLFDALEGIVYANDSQIWEMFGSKKAYSNKVGTYIKLNLYENVEEICALSSYENISQIWFDTTAGISKETLVGMNNTGRVV